MSDEYWAEAVATAAYLWNQTVTAAIKSGETPFERWHRKKPDLKNIRVFGCIVYPEGKRMDAKLRFTGYTSTEGKYRIFDVSKRKTYFRQNLIFNEADFDDVKQIEVELENENPDPGGAEEQPVQEEKEQEERPVRRSERARKPVVRYGIDDYADIIYKACEIDEAGGGDLIKLAIKRRFKRTIRKQQCRLRQEFEKLRGLLGLM